MFGITVYLHWSWLFIVMLAISQRRENYSTMAWPVLEVLSLFGIVLMHEFGHALACKSVGGKAEHIMLWPLGGVAFVSPPMRPGALLWSIFAGPLVNILLLPVTFLALAAIPPGSDLHQYVFALTVINTVLLIFNLLPIYPLDGGQILQSLLWFVVGYVRSLKIASIIGLLGAAGLVVLALWMGLGVMTFIIALFIGMQAFTGYVRARELAKLQQRHGLSSVEDLLRAAQTPEEDPPHSEQPGRRPVPPPMPPSEATFPPRPPRVNPGLRPTTPPPTPGGYLRPPQW